MKKQNSVRDLINLYTVVMGVALSLAITKLVDSGGLQSLTWATSLTFFSFIVTLLPFYHGALRHLGDAYIENDSPNINNIVLLLDFLLLLLHGIIFVLLSVLIAIPNDFAWALILMLAVDIIWGVIFAVFGPSSQGRPSAESKWTIINLVFVLLLGFYLIKNHIFLQHIDDPVYLAVLIAFACVIRTICDYFWAWDFYFPNG